MLLISAAPDKKHVRREVSIVKLQFKPAAISIHAGDLVVWTNNDDRDHTVVSDDGSFKSGNIKAGQSYEHMFEKPGKFGYGCSYHPRMKGTVTAEKQ